MYGEATEDKRQSYSKAEADAQMQREHDMLAKKRDQYGQDSDEWMGQYNALLRTYVNPGAADYGGSPGAAEGYRQSALAGMAGNDPEQQATQRGLNAAYAGMTQQRGPQAEENAILAGREAGVRKDQLGGLGLLRDQAMGLAPSEAAFQTRQGFNDLGANYAGQQGTARGLSALAGAQVGGSSGVGQAAGGIAASGAQGRASEIGSAIGQYGKMSGQVSGQDLTRLGVGNQMAQFNQGLNQDWQLGNANLYNQWGDLGNRQDAADQRWFVESEKPMATQFQLDQDAAGWEAGQSAEQAALSLEKERERKNYIGQVVGGIAQAGLTAIGSLAGPAGAAAGGMAGSAIGAAGRKYY